MTITIQIGNSDDKLTQAEWCHFVRVVDRHIARYVKESSGEVHFFGAPPNHVPWQNAAWIISIHEDYAPLLRGDLSNTKAQFKQDSIAWTEGETKFI